jgi:g-D-glutamyl-meso-diaminopimelate peptidase
VFLRKSSLYLLLFSLIATIIAPPFARTYAAPASIVNPVQLYTYDKMTSDIKKLAAAYPDLIHYESIGKTVYGRDIWAVSLGYGEATIFINGSHHAREWLTTNLNMYMIDQYARAYTSGSTIGKYAARQILNQTTIWFVPMVNPDGVTLQQFGAAAFPQKVRSTLIKFNQGSTNFARWKANAQGVDLNRQYQADWEHIQDAVLYPSYMKYKGSSPVQAQEVKAMVAFTKRINPETAVSYHSAGRIIYWNFRTPKVNLARDQRLASQFAAITGYSLVKPTSNPSGGGYTDWFIQAFGRPAFTPELGIKRGETNLLSLCSMRNGKETKR